MELGNLTLIFAATALLWLMLLSFFLFRTMSHYRRLTQGITQKDLKTVLERIFKNIKDNEKTIKEITHRCEQIEVQSGYHFQKVGFLRYNPFKTTGGDQSFILALLDAHDDGLIISSLHSRESTRLYAKPIKKGKAGQYKLSIEEERVISSAKKASLLV